MNPSAPAPEVSSLKGEIRHVEPDRIGRSIARRSAEVRATVPDVELSTRRPMPTPRRRSPSRAACRCAPCSSGRVRWRCVTGRTPTPPIATVGYELYSRVNVGVTIHSDGTPDHAGAARRRHQVAGGDRRGARSIPRASAGRRADAARAGRHDVHAVGPRRRARRPPQSARHATPGSGAGRRRRADRCRWCATARSCPAECSRSRSPATIGSCSGRARRPFWNASSSWWRTPSHDRQLTRISPSEIAQRGRVVVVERLRAAFAHQAATRPGGLQSDPARLEQLVQEAADRSGGALWHRALAQATGDELGISLAGRAAPTRRRSGPLT